MTFAFSLPAKPDERSSVPHRPCRHQWEPPDVFRQVCAHCGASCERNSQGELVAFDATPTCVTSSWGSR